MKEKIDFVLIWVDGNDKKWQKEKEKYSPVSSDKKIDSSNIRYRDWDNLKYWFRGVEKFAPWVNNIYFITCGHVPEWLNLDNKKLKFIKHSDYMNDEYLPTFNANPIELNFSKIKELEEKFVYFNDDTFIINTVTREDFFKKGLPCDSAIITPIITGENSVSNHMILNDIEFINKNFDLRKVVKNNLFKWLNPVYGTKLLRTVMMLPYKKFPGLAIQHLPNSFLKSSFDEVWEKEYKLLDNTSKTKFRSKDDVNQYVIKFWQLCTGKFYPRKYNIGKNVTISDDNQKIIEMIVKKKAKLLCINDSEQIQNFEKAKNEINEAFEKILPNKSSFEK